MKSLQRYLSLFCCFLLLFVLFSSTVNAAEITSGKIRCYAETWFDGSLPMQYKVAGNVINGSTNRITKQITETSAWGESFGVVYYRFTFINQDNSPIAYADKLFQFVCSGLNGAITVLMPNGDLYFRSLYQQSITMGASYITYTDGTTMWIDASRSNNVYTETAGFKTTFTPTKDVRTITFECYSTNPVGFDTAPNWAIIETGTNAEQPLVVDISVDDSNTGTFLEKIVTKIQQIKDNIVNGFTNLVTSIGNTFEQVKNGFKDTIAQIGSIITKLTELPQRIWSYIKNGLVNLFVPDKMYLEQEFDKWNVLLEDKFGILYQGVSYIGEFFASLDLLATIDSHIYFPEVTIPLPDNNEFSFGGFDVNIIPSKFYPIAQSCKTIVGIICTFAFLNGLRKRYESIVGG